jgi:hypothetical protein
VIFVLFSISVCGGVAFILYVALLFNIVNLLDCPVILQKMEKLPDEKRVVAKKMSSVRFVTYLFKAGYDPDPFADSDRDSPMKHYAEFLSSEVSTQPQEAVSRGRALARVRVLTSKSGAK